MRSTLLSSLDQVQIDFGHSTPINSDIREAQATITISFSRKLRRRYGRCIDKLGRAERLGGVGAGYSDWMLLTLRNGRPIEAHVLYVFGPDWTRTYLALSR